jgi:hypothetical protein
VFVCGKRVVVCELRVMSECIVSEVLGSHSSSCSTNNNNNNCSPSIRSLQMWNQSHNT